MNNLTAPPTADAQLSSVPGIVFALLFVLMFGPSLLELREYWEKDPNYSHGYLVALAFLLLLGRTIYRSPLPTSGEPRIGLISISVGAIIHLFAVLLKMPMLEFVALALVLRGTAVALGGTAWARKFTFPILFLFFMFPVPVTWTSYAALWLQENVSRVSVGILNLLTVAHRHGTKISIAGLPDSLVVAEECSGLRQIVAFLAMGSLAGYLGGRPTWYRLILLFLGVVFAVVANVLRILLMAYGAMKFGTGWMSGWLHHAPALFCIPVGIVLFLITDWILDRVFFARPSSPPNSEDDSTVASQEPGASRPRLWLPILNRLRSAAFVLAFFVGAQLLLTMHLTSAGSNSFPVPTGPLASLPLRLLPPVGTDEKASWVWIGQDVSGLERLRKQLPYEFNEVILRNYSAEGQTTTAQVYAVYSKTGDDRKHHPEICMREATGAPEDYAARAVIPIDPEGQRKVMRFRFQTGTSQFATVYYWHYALMPAPDPNQTALQRLHQRLGQIAPSITVQVWTSSSRLEDVERVERSLLASIDAAFRQRVLPPTAEMDCTRLPVALARE